MPATQVSTASALLHRTSPVLRLQLVARTVGLLQVALQLLLPLPVGCLLLAQAPVLSLKLQKRLPADQTPGSERCWDPAAGRGDQERDI